MWTVSYILSQVAVIFAVSILASTYLIKNRKLIYMLTNLYALFYAISYFLLGAWIGVILNLVSMVRNIWFMIEFDKNKKISIISLILNMIMLSTASVLTSVLTVFNPIDILVLSEVLVYTFSLWQKNNKVFRWLALYSSACWLTYNIYVFSLFAIILEGCLLCAKTVGICLLYVREGKRKKIVKLEEKQAE